ncbi:MAG: dioxygenase [Alphaproteobacteria bacterium]|nr:dioxygenase [Alphaproteobacteria bacterium]
MRMPTLFLSHGAPTVVLSKTPASAFLRSLASHVPAPKAILVVSAHWEAARPTVGLGVDTIHDFYGFPKPLYELQYPAPLARDVATRAAALLKPADVAVDATRGRDHGVWTPLILAWPDAQVPVVQVSLVGGAAPQTHYDIGRALAPLRNEGVLIVGSGSATHNLRARPTPAPAEWATRFVGWLDGTLTRGDDAALLDWKHAAPHAEINHPTPEHFDPIFVARGAAAGEAATLLHASYEFGSLSMNAYSFGT